ncbi:phospholipid/cholesterol/gamma-HCH transport system permease protein [Andreprevotia lacus DSM 23236]|jgi:phospholipid/cholesterol/gamma-HCH transport system permease protein|uniref:Phospholipid/cholesterol/gamma-HCH transport system permease protein n=1 Tax=Andreprevotia lacus DSM 23236 TaxID=1121001 RepID=A0A1W1XQM4_9NEIS|nr:ABC transporter permease [Andreprevotia lacus]SMC26177.1 phospholipid/cholesterol/gamma-HCH transport system permease protein [Andreprevotia lacus DSM 23236]
MTATLTLRDDTLLLSGRLDATGCAAIWPAARSSAATTVDASAVDYCDGAGIALLFELSQRGIRIDGLSDGYAAMLQALRPDQPLAQRATARRAGWIEVLGRVSARTLASVQDRIAFLGGITVAARSLLLSPQRFRYAATLDVAGRAGADALPIVGLISFLLGVILAFQSAIPMKQFGAELFVANLVGLGLVRELSPLMTAVLLAGRTGAAFAAELGTMKTNQEIDALTTMGLDPMRFLVLPRLVAVTLMTPLLTVLAEVIGLFGGGLVLLTLDIPLKTAFSQAAQTVALTDYVGGLFKAAVFGFGIAAIGCWRGLRTGSGAQAVGDAATSAVVTSLVFLVVSDGLFALAYYYLGW